MDEGKENKWNMIIKVNYFLADSCRSYNPESLFAAGDCEVGDGGSAVLLAGSWRVRFPMR
jgi:hypothetical protein